MYSPFFKEMKTLGLVGLMLTIVPATRRGKVTTHTLEAGLRPAGGPRRPHQGKTGSVNRTTGTPSSSSVGSPMFRHKTLTKTYVALSESSFEMATHL